MNFSECPKCGAPPVGQAPTRCTYCGVTFQINSVGSAHSLSVEDAKKFIATFRSKATSGDSGLEVRLATALCHLRMENFAIAKPLFTRLLTDFPESPDAYYMLALSILAGRKLKTISLGDAREIEGLLNNAIAIDEKQEYWLLMAGLKYGYFRTNGLKIPSPTDDEIIASNSIAGVNPVEARALLASIGLNVEKFSGYAG